MSELSRRIAERRKNLKLSQEDLAELIGTNQRQISRYETGANDPSSDVLVALARALETTPDWLLGFAEGMNSKGDLSPEERQLIALYRRKSPEMRHKVLEVARVL